MKPTLSILKRSIKGGTYTSADNTNIRKRFADIRYQQIMEKRQREEGLAPDAPNIIPLRKAEP